MKNQKLRDSSHGSGCLLSVPGWELLLLWPASSGEQITVVQKRQGVTTLTHSATGAITPIYVTMMARKCTE